MYHPRAIDIEADRQSLLDFHYRASYQSSTPAFKTIPYEKAFAWWLGTPQVGTFLDELKKSQDDPRTIVEIWEAGGVPAGFVWVRFTDIPAYRSVFAEIEDLSVMPDHRRRGLATTIISHVEKLARERGAGILRSGTGIDNEASRKLHEKLGFEAIHVNFEKSLEGEPRSYLRPLL